MPDPSYEILPLRGRCPLSYGDDEYKDKDKYKDKEKVHRRPNIYKTRPDQATSFTRVA